METKNLLTLKGRKFKLEPKGAPNPIIEFNSLVRRVLIEMGFEEVVLPMIVKESDVYQEYGPEAPVILDRLFYLAGLPRPDIGLGADSIKKIREIVPDFDKVKELQDILRRYKKNEIESDDLVETMVTELGVREEQATSILDNVFLEFKERKPVPTDLTLRSHMTALWFPVLSAVMNKWKLPIQLFTIGRKFRREQRLDATHLYSSYTASFVIMAEEITLEDGMEIVRDFLRRIGFQEVDFRFKKATSKYYAPQTEFEIFVRHPKSGDWLEVGDSGFYSPVSLAKFGIEYPVLNAGFGIERFVMIKTGETDIRRLSYPYFYKDVGFTDEEIAEGIYIEEKPQTEIGKKIMQELIKTAETHRDAEAPCEFVAWSGIIDGKKVSVKIVEKDKDTKLLGPAILNRIYVYDGNILGLPEEKAVGTPTDIRYLDALGAYAARRIEEMIEKNEKNLDLRIRIAKKASDVNIGITTPVRHFITSKSKKIDIRGPVFFTVSASVE
ncbi:MAG: O-phosphoserine--tRNA ligase [Candidatus Jordarchaeaceae archaeon]